MKKLALVLFFGAAVAIAHGNQATADPGTPDGGSTTTLARCNIFPTNEDCWDSIPRDPNAPSTQPVEVPLQAPPGPSGSGLDGKIKPGPGAIGSSR